MFHEKKGRYFKACLFFALVLIMTARYFSVLSLSFDITSERFPNSMIAASIMNLDMSEQQFGLHLLSCDNIIYDGLGKDSISGIKKINDGTLYLVYHSPEFANKNVQIASTRLQQYGIQGWIVYYLSLAWHLVSGKISPQYWYFMLRALFISLMAIVLTAVSFQIYKAYDILFAASFYCVCLTSTWLTNFAPNLYWASFTWFMPMLFSLMCMNSKRAKILPYFMVSASVAFKSLCGYEYLSVVMMCAIAFPLSEYLSCTKLETLRKRKMFKITLGIGLSALVGFIATFAFHAWLLGKGNIMNGLSRILYDTHALQRIGFSEDVDPSTKSITVILARYLLPPSGWYVLCIFIISLLSIRCAKIKHNIPVRQGVCLLLLSLCSSLSWFILARNHSYVHIHINHVLWVMPFMPTALYVFLKYRIMTLIPAPEKYNTFINSVCSFVKSIFWLS